MDKMRISEKITRKLLPITPFLFFQFMIKGITRKKKLLNPCTQRFTVFFIVRQRSFISCLILIKIAKIGWEMTYATNLCYLIEDRKLFTIFNQVAQIGGVGHLPTYLGDFDQYQARYKRSLPDDEKHGKSLRARIQKFLFSRDSFDHELKEQEGGYREQLSCDLLTYPHFVHYLQLAQHYIKALNDRVVARERKLIQEETLRFGTEFFKGLRQLPVPKKPLRKMASDVIASVYALTRVGSELYYQATGKLFAPQPRYRSLRTKYCDRLANSSDLRPSKRQTEKIG